MFTAVVLVCAVFTSGVQEDRCMRFVSNTPKQTIEECEQDTIKLESFLMQDEAKTHIFTIFGQPDGLATFRICASPPGEEA